MLSKAEVQSNSLSGFVVAYPTSAKMRHTRKAVPGTIPSASGLEGGEGCEILSPRARLSFHITLRWFTYIGVLSVGVPFFPRSLPQMPRFSVYFCE